MIKTGCIFDVDKIESFYETCKKQVMLENNPMTFFLAENDEYFGMMQLFQRGEDCEIGELCTREENEEYEEFLLKSGINLALTFAGKRMFAPTKYAKWLVPMGFCELDGEMVASFSDVDFPSKCGKNHK